MSFVKFENPTILLCTITLQNSANAGADVLVDALMVMQAKRDPVNGSQELQSLSWLLVTIVSLILGFTGAYMVSAYGPYSLFLTQSVAGLVTLLVSIMMSPQLEIEGDFEAEALVNIDPGRSGVRLQSTFSDEVKHNWNVVKNALKIKILREIYIYYVLVALTFPFLWNFMYYFQRDVAELSQVKIQLL